MRAAVQRVFRATSATYDRENPLLLVERQETGRVIPDVAGRRVLDLGSGSGHYAAEAVRRGARLAVALDLVWEMACRSPRPALVADGACLPLASASFDAVVAALVLSYVEDPGAAIAEMARVLRPGGAVIISDLHPACRDLGWRRTFSDGRGAQLEIDAPPLALADIERAFETHDLAVTARREIAIDGRLREAFRRAGRRDFGTLAGTPLLVVVRAHKEGGRHGG